MLPSAWPLMKERVAGWWWGVGGGVLGHLEGQAGQEGRVRFGPPDLMCCCLLRLPDGEVLGPLARRGLALRPVLGLGRKAGSLG